MTKNIVGSAVAVCLVILGFAITHADVECEEGCNSYWTGDITTVMSCRLYEPYTCMEEIWADVDEGGSCIAITPLTRIDVYSCPEEHCSPVCNNCPSQFEYGCLQFSWIGVDGVHSRFAWLKVFD